MRRSCLAALQPTADRHGRSTSKSDGIALPCAIRPSSAADHGPVGFLEPALGALGVLALLDESFRVPFAAFGRKEIATVNVDGRGEPRDRIGHGMDYVAAQGVNIASSQRLGTGGF